MNTNTKITVILTSELRLNQALKQAGVTDPATVTHLTVAGKISVNDFEYIREKMRESLQELDLGDALVNGIFVGSKGYRDFYRLSSITIPDSLSDDISFHDFKECIALKSITARSGNPFYASEDGVLFNKDKTKLFIHLEGRQGDYLIPASVEKIEEGSFYHSQGLVSITAHPDNPAFASENGILFNKDKTELIRYPEGLQGDCFIPASVEKINRYAFFCCVGLASFTVHPDNPAFASEDGVLFNKDKTKLIHYPAALQGNYAIPDSVVEIGEFAFSFCSDLTSIFIPRSVIEINYLALFGSNAFFTTHPNNRAFRSENGDIISKTSLKFPFSRSKSDHYSFLYVDNDRFFDLLFAKTYNEDAMFKQCSTYCCAKVTVRNPHLFADIEGRKADSKYPVMFEEAEKRISKMITHFREQEVWEIEHIVSPTAIELTFIEYELAHLGDDENVD